MMNTFTQFIGLICLAVILNGCVGVAINSSTLALKALPRAQLEELAEQGDADAQYELGLSHCCMGVGFDTQIATEWLCKAAHQRQVDAMYELGRIYLGEVSRTPAPVQKVIRVATARESYPHAYMWLTLANDMNHKDAGRKLSSLKKDISEEDVKQSLDFTENWEIVACEYNDVFKEN